MPCPVRLSEMQRLSIVKLFLGVTGPFLGTHLVSRSRPQIRILVHTVWLPRSDPTHLINVFQHIVELHVLHSPGSWFLTVYWLV